MVCLKLHNLYIDKSCTVQHHHYAEGVWPGDEWAVHDNIRQDDPLHRVQVLGEHRRLITAYLEHMGILLPAHAQMYSQCC
jgi:hypothetical protein